MLTYSMTVCFCAGWQRVRGQVIAECKITHVKELGIVENLAVFEVVSFCITEALFEVIFDSD